MNQVELMALHALMRPIAIEAKVKAEHYDNLIKDWEKRTPKEKAYSEAKLLAIRDLHTEVLVMKANAPAKMWENYKTLFGETQFNEQKLLKDLLRSLRKAYYHAKDGHQEITSGSSIQSERTGNDESSS